MAFSNNGGHIKDPWLWCRGIPHSSRWVRHLGRSSGTVAHHQTKFQSLGCFRWCWAPCSRVELCWIYSHPVHPLPLMVQEPCRQCIGGQVLLLCPWSCPQLSSITLSRRTCWGDWSLHKNSRSSAKANPESEFNKSTYVNMFAFLQEGQLLCSKKVSSRQA